MQTPLLKNANHISSLARFHTKYAEVLSLSQSPEKNHLQEGLILFSFRQHCNFFSKFVAKFATFYRRHIGEQEHTVFGCKYISRARIRCASRLLEKCAKSFGYPF